MNIVAIQCRTNTGELMEVPVREFFSMSGEFSITPSGTVPKSNGKEYVASGITVDANGVVTFKSYTKPGIIDGTASGIIAHDANGRLITIPITLQGQTQKQNVTQSSTGTSTENILPVYSDGNGTLSDSTILKDGENYSVGGAAAFFKWDVSSGSVNVNQGTSVENGYRLNGKLVVSYDPATEEITIGNATYTTTNIENVKVKSAIWSTALGGTITDVAFNTAGNYTLIKPAENGTYATREWANTNTWLINGNTVTAEKSFGTLDDFNIPIVQYGNTVAVFNAKGASFPAIQEGELFEGARDFVFAGIDLAAPTKQLIKVTNSQATEYLSNYLWKVGGNALSSSQVMGSVSGSNYDIPVHRNGIEVGKWRTGGLTVPTLIASNLTANYVAKHTASGLVNSLIYENSTFVGIGVTSNTNVRLQVDVANVANTKLLKFSTSSGANNYGDFSIQSAELRLNGQYAIGIAPNNTVSAFFATSGNVGIGTTSPSTKLHVSSTTNTQLLVEGTGANTFPSLALKNDATTWFLFNDGSTSDIFNIYNSSSRLAITTGGNVGIGTTTPGSLLDVNGLATVRGNLNVWGGNGSNSGLITANSAGGGLYIAAVGTNQNIRLVPTGTGFVQATTNLSVNGNLGVGSNPSSYKFEVIGTGHFTGAVTFDTVPSSLQDATSSNHLVRYSQWIASTSVKYLPTAVKTVSLTNITLSGTQTVNGVALIAGDRILVAGQATASANGVYEVTAGAWTRSIDSDTDAELRGFIVNISGGTYAGYKYINTNTSAITVGTTSITYAEFSNLSELDPIFTAWRDNTRTANTFWAAPNGSNGVATWRGLVAADVPTLNQNTTGSAATLTTIRNIAMTGDVDWNVSFNGSTDVTAVGTLATISDSGSGTFLKVTRNTKGLITGTQAVAQADITGLLGANSITNTMINSLAWSKLTSVPTTLSGYGITDAQSTITAYAPLYLDSGDLTISRSSSIANGYLHQEDWTFFNDKQGKISLYPDYNEEIDGMVLMTNALSFKWTTLTTSHISNLSSYTGFDTKYVHLTGNEDIFGQKIFKDTLAIKNSSGNGLLFIQGDYNQQIIGNGGISIKPEVAFNVTVNGVGSIGATDTYINMYQPTTFSSDIIYNGLLKIGASSGTINQVLMRGASNNAWTTLTTSHISNLSSYTGLDARYYTKTESDGRYVDLTTNQLSINGNKTFNGVIRSSAISLTQYGTPTDGWEIQNVLSGGQRYLSFYNEYEDNEVAALYSTGEAIYGKVLVGGGTLTDVTESLVVNGNIKYSGLLKIGASSGTNGQFLKRTSTANEWATITASDILPTATTGQVLAFDGTDYNAMHLEIAPSFLKANHLAIGNKFNMLSHRTNVTLEDELFFKITKKGTTKSVCFGFDTTSSNGVFDVSDGSIYLNSDNLFVSSLKGGSGTSNLGVDNLTGKLVKVSSSGGGTGSQDLNSVLAVGSTAIDKPITLNSTVTGIFGSALSFTDKGIFRGRIFNDNQFVNRFIIESEYKMQLYSHTEGIELIGNSLKVSHFAGSGTKMVVTDNSGFLSLATIPSGGSGSAISIPDHRIAFGASDNSLTSSALLNYYSSTNAIIMNNLSGGDANMYIHNPSANLFEIRTNGTINGFSIISGTIDLTSDAISLGVLGTGASLVSIGVDTTEINLNESLYNFSNSLSNGEYMLFKKVSGKMVAQKVIVDGSNFIKLA